MKLIKSRQNYKCYNCKTKIKKGEKYARKSVSIGQPWKPEQLKKDDTGMVYIEFYGVRTAEPICEPCAIK